MSENDQLSEYEIQQRVEKGEDLSGINISGKDFTHLSLRAARMINAVGHKAGFLKADLTLANFSGADLPEAFFVGAKLYEANFEGANLKAADFGSADLTAAKFINTNLEGANFSQAKLMGTNFTGANLTRANLRKTDLTSANLNGVNLERADTFEAKLTEEKPRRINIIIDKGGAKQLAMAALVIIASVVVSGFIAYLINAALNRAWIVPLGVTIGLAGSVVVLFTNFMNSRVFEGLDTEDMVRWAMISLISMLILGVLASLASIVAHNYWIIPGTMLVGLVVSSVIVYYTQRATNAAVSYMTGQHTEEEEYPEMKYRSDMVHANALLRALNHREALNCFLEITRKAPEKIEPMFKIARIYHSALNDPEKAIFYYQKIINKFTRVVGKDHMYIFECEKYLNELNQSQPE